MDEAGHVTNRAGEIVETIEAMREDYGPQYAFSHQPAVSEVKFMFTVWLYAGDDENGDPLFTAEGVLKSCGIFHSGRFPVGASDRSV